jgi:hypothetical protein
VLLLLLLLEGCCWWVRTAAGAGLLQLTHAGMSGAPQLHEVHVVACLTQTGIVPDARIMLPRCLLLCCRPVPSPLHPVVTSETIMPTAPWAAFTSGWWRPTRADKMRAQQAAAGVVMALS